MRKPQTASQFDVLNPGSVTFSFGSQFLGQCHVMMETQVMQTETPRKGPTLYSRLEDATSTVIPLIPVRKGVVRV